MSIGFPFDLHPAARSSEQALRHGVSRVVAAGLALTMLLTTPLVAQVRPVAVDSAPSLRLTDSLLPAALHTALRQAPELMARRAALAAAEMRLRATGFVPAAVLSSELEDAPNGRLGESSVRVGVEREFLTGSLRAAARDAATADVRIADAMLQAAELRSTAQALRAGVEAIGWGLVSNRLAAQDSLLQSAEVSLRTRFTVGDARYVDVLRLRTERLRVQADRSVAFSQARTGALTLEALLGAGDVEAGDVVSRTVAVALDTTTRGTFASFLQGDLPPAPDVDLLIARSGMLQLVDAQVARAVSAQRMVLASQRPLLTAGFGVQRIGGDDGGIGPTIGASVTLPFTARTRNRATAAAAAQDVTTATALRRASLATLRGRLRTARDRYEAARGRIAAFDISLLRGAREERESALAAYRSGDLSLIELLDFERALSRAEVERTRAIIDAASALADLVGGLAETAESSVELPSAFGVTDER